MKMGDAKAIILSRRKKILKRFSQFSVPKNDFENQSEFAIFSGAVDNFGKVNSV